MPESSDVVAELTNRHSFGGRNERISILSYGEQKSEMKDESSSLPRAYLRAKIGYHGRLTSQVSCTRKIEHIPLKSKKLNLSSDLNAQ